MSADRKTRTVVAIPLRAAATLIERTKDVDVSNLTDSEFAQVDEVLTQIIGDAIWIGSRLNK